MDRFRTKITAPLVFIAFAAGLTGCAKRSALSSSPSANSEAKKATPIPMSVSVHNGVDATIFDAKGAIVATVKASASNVGPSDANASDPIGTARDASAVLYQAGTPTATFQAARLRADGNAGTVWGEGGVTIHSLTQSGSPTVRADTMTWTRGENRVVGRGSVLLTRQGDAHFPATHLTGTHFTADTAVRKYVLYDVGAPTNLPVGATSAPTGNPTAAPVASGKF